MHQVMLSDRVRLDSYDKALAEAVTPGAVVADIGAGLLPLTALALKHGAAHVYAIEADPEVAALAQRLVEANGWRERVDVLAGDAGLVRLPQKVDVVVTELMGNLGPEEDMARLLRLFTRQWLRPGGRVVPERMVTYLAPIQFDDEGWGVWHEGFLNMRLDVVQEHVAPGAQLHVFTRPPVVLGEPVTLVDSTVDPRLTGIQRPVRLPVDRAGCLQAVVGFFDATLVPGVSIANFPSYPGCNWAVWVWPLRHTPVAPGDVVRSQVRLPDDRRQVSDWQLACQLSRNGR